MSLLDPQLLQRLAHLRLRPRRAVALTGVGEHRSRGKGPGIEFADHRAYQPGDDIRHLDRHVYARLGRHVIKQFSLYQQLQVTILVDASASMAFGQPPKLRRAAELAGGLAYLGLTGGDQVLVGAFTGAQVSWYPRLQGARQVQGLFRWLERVQPQGGTELRRVLHESIPRLQPGGLLIVISDWLTDATEAALAAWHHAGQELVGVHLLAPEELEPDRLGTGPVRVIDAESGLEVETSLDADTLTRYRLELQRWMEQLRGLFYKQDGRYFRTRSDDALDSTLLGEWRAKGFIS
jgi:uncharacterized protein (DUF58 family)